MVIIIVVALLSIISLSWLGWFARRELDRRRSKRMSDNAYNTALTLWNFARVIKDQLDEVGRGRAEVIDFTNISVPAGTGYNVCLELAGYGFRLHAVPERYDRTGRISLYVDNALTVRAWDRGGENATAEDPEYTGEDPVIDLAAPSAANPDAHEDLIHQGNRITSDDVSSERIVVQGDRIEGYGIEGAKTQAARIEATKTPAAKVRPRPMKARPFKPRPINPGPINPNTSDPGPIKPNSIQPDSIQPDPIKPDLIKSDPVKSDPIRGDSVRRYSVRPAPIKGDRPNSNRGDRIT
ncbi:MAG TPA: hypothetical protein VKJ45_04410 [Blastocatellia bacterium]|nr:hypothetical protein [Blastocatellia bacterium]